jgi:hypothetical protein
VGGSHLEPILRVLRLAREFFVRAESAGAHA